MLDDNFSLLRERVAAIKALPVVPSFADVSTPAFHLRTEGDVQVYFAPFDAINPAAKVMIVGITPGQTQMLLAFQAARQALLAGKSVEEASAQAKVHASFGGAIRTNLVAMLDGIGLAGALKITSTASLFGADAGLLHATSAIRYPTFYRGRNYTGHVPKLVRTPCVMEYVQGTLAAELTAVAQALVLPCGEAVEEALRHLVRTGAVDERRCLFGFPHPSPGNGWRAQHYAQRKDALAAQVRAFFAPPASV